MTLSGQNLTVDDIHRGFMDYEAATRAYYAPSPAAMQRFFGYTQAELFDEMSERLAELEYMSMLSLLSSLEASLRVDFIIRCRNREKDPVSKKYRTIFRSIGREPRRIDLERHVIEIRQSDPAHKALLSQVKGAFKMRHWLAHGRYWVPKLGAKYDYWTVHALVTLTVASLGLDR